MKYLLPIFLTTLLIIVSACGADTEEYTENKNNESKTNSDQSRSEQTDSQNDETNANGLETTEEFFNTGDFETLKGINDVGTYEIGPVAFDIMSVLVKKGALDEDTFEDFSNIPRGEITFVQVHTKLITTNKEINFSEENFQLSLDSDNSLIEVEGFLSTSMWLNSAYAETKDDEKNYNVTLAFVLDDTEVEDVQNFSLHVKPPTDKVNNAMGTPIEIDIPSLINNK